MYVNLAGFANINYTHAQASPGLGAIPSPQVVDTRPHRLCAHVLPLWHQIQSGGK